ncbi:MULTISPECIES: DNA topoisomerase IB [unclassified Sphingomonas]|uniref:DNA topoisomerase IB n=1 Tax=unclassified Sphingomonas TaxID=196159 RepID=UPI000B0F4EC5|nr:MULTISPECIES: DNA topoisomerase IB [unclassified Sphingomonas]
MANEPDISVAIDRLVFVDDGAPGITRRLVRGKWGYWDARGARITDRDEIDRLNAVALPPAYQRAWFCPDPRGHIQATGFDEKGRKQYRYHPDFRAAQEAAKFDRCASFGERLPRLRARVEADLNGRALSRERAIAAVVRLLDLGRVRIGNEGYARTNKSYGATTLRKRHAALKGHTLRLQYRAKSGRLCVVTLTDRSLSRFVKRVQDLPGQHLFRWIDAAGEARPVTSSDVNDYIRAAMGEAFSAKHFRTWGASVIAFHALVQAGGRLPLKALLEPVVAALGNTPAVARKSYVHPRLIDACRGVAPLPEPLLRLPRQTRYLERAERGLIALLRADDPQLSAKAA